MDWEEGGLQQLGQWLHDKNSCFVSSESYRYEYVVGKKDYNCKLSTSTSDSDKGEGVYW